MHAILETRLDIAFVVSTLGRFATNPLEYHESHSVTFDALRIKESSTDETTANSAIGSGTNMANSIDI
jgi:hypothetical protein